MISAALALGFGIAKEFSLALADRWEEQARRARPGGLQPPVSSKDLKNRRVNQGISRRNRGAMGCFFGPGSVANATGFDFAPDGKRMVVTVPASTQEPSKQEHTVVFVQNFFDELRRLAPVGP